mgnify:CR=1 FL=1
MAVKSSICATDVSDIEPDVSKTKARSIGEYAQAGLVVVGEVVVVVVVGVVVIVVVVGVVVIVVVGVVVVVVGVVVVTVVVVHSPLTNVMFWHVARHALLYVRPSVPHTGTYDAGHDAMHADAVVVVASSMENGAAGED